MLAKPSIFRDVRICPDSVRIHKDSRFLGFTVLISGHDLDFKPMSGSVRIPSALDYEAALFVRMYMVAGPRPDRSTRP